MDVNSASFSKNKRKILIFIIPFASCAISSIIGVLIGQAGNLIYTLVGGISGVVCLPAYCLLFFVTAGISILISMILKKLFHHVES